MPAVGRAVQACIDQGSWDQYAEIGMAFVAALPIYVALSDHLVYCPHDRHSGKEIDILYENR